METEFPHCQKVLSVPEYYEGKQIKCVSCHKTLVAKPMAKKLNHQPDEQSPPSDSNLKLWIEIIALSSVCVLFILIFSIDYALGILFLFIMCWLYSIWQRDKKARCLQELVIGMKSILYWFSVNWTNPFHS